MKIPVCGNCHAKNGVDTNIIPIGDRAVFCTKCQHFGRISKYNARCIYWSTNQDTLDKLELEDDKWMLNNF